MMETRSKFTKSSVDPATQFFYVPRTVTCLLLGLLALIYFSKPFNPDRSPSDPYTANLLFTENIKAATWAILAVYLGYSTMQGPLSPLVRPHPSVWRFVHGILICYLMFLVFLLFQTVDDARQFLAKLYPNLGVELPERAYGDSCDLWITGQGINWKVLQDTVFDEFVLAHALGWWGKAVILRDNYMLWTLSIGFELMEKTFQHMLPNFNECWWDSWILDVLMCNWLGIATGMWTVRYFKSKEYNWRGISQQPTLLAKAKRGLLQFTPASFTDFQWAAFSSPKRLAQFLFLPAIFLIFEVNHFFLKYALWVPPTNPMNTYILIIQWLAGIPSIMEYYEFIESSESGTGSGDVFTKLGPYAWTTLAIALIETLVVVKYSHGLFVDAPWPMTVVVGWSVALGVFGVLYGAWCWRCYFGGKVTNSKSSNGKRKKRV